MLQILSISQRGAFVKASLAATAAQSVWITSSSADFVLCSRVFIIFFQETFLAIFVFSYFLFLRESRFSMA